MYVTVPRCQRPSAWEVDTGRSHMLGRQHVTQGLVVLQDRYFLPPCSHQLPNRCWIKGVPLHLTDPLPRAVCAPFQLQICPSVYTMYHTVNVPYMQPAQNGLSTQQVVGLATLALVGALAGYTATANYLATSNTVMHYTAAPATQVRAPTHLQANPVGMSIFLLRLPKRFRLVLPCFRAGCM